MVKLKINFKKRNQLDEEIDGERSVKKRKQNDGERAIVISRSGIDEKEEEEERAIVEKRKQIDGEENMDVVVGKLGEKIDETELNEKERLVGEKSIDGDHSLPTPCKYLPEDLMIEGILTRLPARELINCSCTSKLWYNTIFNNSRFATSHFVHNQNKLSMFFDLYNVCVNNTKKAFYFRVVEVDNAMCDVACMTALSNPGTVQTAGHCNGLTCIKQVNSRRHKLGTLMVINPIRGEQFGLHYATPTGCIYLCSGFGFDPLSQAYKAVVIFTSETNDEFVCMVFTLGTDSWRKIATTTDEMSPPPGSPPFPSRMVTIVSRGPPTLCGGDLYWRVTYKVRDNSRTEMLLLFDLHSEKIKFIRFPTECTLIPPPATTTTMNEQHQYLAVDHLLEFKGYPCIARSEKIMISNSDHRGHRCVDQSSFCCCCCKVHLYILKDKVKQVWIKEETFDVQIQDPEDILRGPLCCYFGTTTNVTTPPPHVLTFSDQVILSWFNGDYLILYNLRKKDLDVVIVSRSHSVFFRTKTNPAGMCISDDNIYPRDMDYQLRLQVENMVSLKTFIPKGAETSTYNNYDDWDSATDKNPRTGYVIAGKKSVNIYTFG